MHYVNTPTLPFVLLHWEYVFVCALMIQHKHQRAREKRSGHGWHLCHFVCLISPRISSLRGNIILRLWRHRQGEKLQLCRQGVTSQKIMPFERLFKCSAMTFIPSLWDARNGNYGSLKFWIFMHYTPILTLGLFNLHLHSDSLSAPNCRAVVCSWLVCLHFHHLRLYSPWDFNYT